MIKVNELRVGSIVLIPKYENYLPEQKVVYKVESICEGGIKVKYAGWGGDEPYSIEPSIIEDEIEGIPLTPEILEKCGFVKCNSQYGGYLIHIGEGEQIRIVNDETIGWHYPLNGYQRPKTNFLHQLQNLYFALTGEELPITL